jgi:NAD(P)-dependent dehydrogenase (short-subunit alcohol dehydrogenase family)
MSHDKLCIITGASRGLGKAFAEKFWSAGWNLVLVSRDIADLNRLTNSFEIKNNQEIFCFSVDLSKPHEVMNFTENVKLIKKNLKVIINNAAIHGPIGPISTGSSQDWQDTIQVNFLSPVLICKDLIDFMSDPEGGAIINISGGGATSPRINFSAYASSKTALVRFSETLSLELINKNIRVNCISPGAMRTQLLEELLIKGSSLVGDKEFESAQKVLSTGGASLESVAELALFLASDDSNGITGKLISAQWDDWRDFPNHLKELNSSDIYTLRRIVAKDRGFDWGDK